jgi:hypothetical protein
MREWLLDGFLGAGPDSRAVGHLYARFLAVTVLPTRTVQKRTSRSLPGLLLCCAVDKQKRKKKTQLTANKLFFPSLAGDSSAVLM